jgi:hypothetical protein
MDIKVQKCPMCSFCVSHGDEYYLQLHFEQEHTDDSPFKITDDQYGTEQSAAEANAPADADFDNDYVQCPEAECGEDILIEDFNDHMDLHAAEKVTLDTAHPSSSSSVASGQFDDTLENGPDPSVTDGKRATAATEKLRKRSHNRSSKSRLHRTSKSTGQSSRSLIGQLRRESNKQSKFLSARLGVSLLH